MTLSAGRTPVNVYRLLGKLLKEERNITPKLEEFYSKHPEEELTEEASYEFADITDQAWGIEALIGRAASTAILMAAIDLESTINRFCFFELGETTADAIESLPMAAKLERAMNFAEGRSTRRPFSRRKRFETAALRPPTAPGAGSGASRNLTPAAHNARSATQGSVRPSKVHNRL